MPLTDGKLVCDVCGATITRVTEFPPEGWPKLHLVCSACYADMAKKAVAR